MPTQDLVDFFRAKRAHAGNGDTDWDRRKADWVAAIDALYETVAAMLQPVIDAKSVRLDYRRKTITEDFMGTYEVAELALIVGDETVMFSPKARNIIGGSGRVDLRGEMGECTLVLQSGDRWSVVTQRTPNVRIVELNQDTLLDALRRVMRP